MEVDVTDFKRRPWTADDKTRLIQYWSSVGSVVLISLLLKRPEGSVQTEASRLGLPRRNEDRGRHRKKWFDDETDNLIAVVDRCRDRDGKIRIIEVANKTGRSVDAIVTRLSEHLGTRESVKDQVVATEAEIVAYAQTLKQAPSATPGSTVRIDTRKIPKMRPCLTCSRPFYSQGAGNRICTKCHASDFSEW